MERTSIIERIKIKLDEFTPVDEGVSHPLDSYIQPTLSDAIPELIRNAPFQKLPPEDVELYEKNDDGDITGTIIDFEQPSGFDADPACIVTFPHDIVQVASIRFPEWSRPVFNFVDPLSPVAGMQYVRATRGGLSKPVVVLDRGGSEKEGFFVARCFSHPEIEKNEDGSFKEEPEIKVLHLKKPEEIDDFLIEALVLLTASKVMAAIQNFEVSKVLYEQYTNNLMQ
ncbi:MAG: hypothetical protein ACOCTM_02430 [Bacteroidota bacterium]